MEIVVENNFEFLERVEQTLIEYQTELALAKELVLFKDRVKELEEENKQLKLKLEIVSKEFGLGQILR